MNTAGMACCCIGVGSEYPASATEESSCSLKPSSSKLEMLNGLPRMPVSRPDKAFAL
tara:strand:- start:2384 stop:2554 length:171 start_codon:yes stop_codon:yes gene_type:complete